jgi:hypothetical protein
MSDKITNKPCNFKSHKKFINAVIDKLKSINKDLKLFCDYDIDKKFITIHSNITLNDKEVAFIVSYFNRKHDYIWINELKVDKSYRKNKLGSILMCVIIYACIELSKTKKKVKWIKLSVDDNYIGSREWQKIMEKIYNIKENKIKIKKILNEKADKFRLVNWYNKEFDFEVETVDIPPFTYIHMTVPVEKITQKCDILTQFLQK